MIPTFFAKTNIALAQYLLSLARSIYSLWQVINQHIRALPIYGQNVNVICHPYITDILRYT